MPTKIHETMLKINTKKRLEQREIQSTKGRSAARSHAPFRRRGAWRSERETTATRGSGEEAASGAWKPRGGSIKDGSRRGGRTLAVGCKVEKQAESSQPSGSGIRV